MKAPVIALVGARRVALPFRPALVRELVPPGRAGCYLLFRGELPRYIGRSGSCLRTRLEYHPMRGLATHFVFETCTSAASAFLLECAWYHRLGTSLANKIHPAQPRGEGGLVCPVCDVQTMAAVRRALGSSAA